MGESCCGQLVSYTTCLGFQFYQYFYIPRKLGFGDLSFDEMVGCLVLWLFVGPAGVCLLGFFCSGIQFYLLLGPCLCSVSLLCLDLYVLGDDALMGWGSFMRDRYLCVLIHI